MAMRTIGVKLRMDTSEYVKDTGKATAATEKLSEGIGKTGTKAKADWDEIAKGAGIAGLALVGLAGAAVATAASFDKQMSEVGAVANATGKDLNNLREAALRAGKDTSFSATEAAKAQAELAKAGVSTADILGGGLTGALSLAAAGSLDLAEAATVSAKAMNVFQLSGEDVGHIADVLAAAANKSATDVHDLGLALQQGGQAAQQAGLGLEETVGGLALFADHALIGSDAGTSLKSMLLALAAPSEKAAELMEKLGINAYDAQGNFVGLEGLAGQLQDRLGNLTQEQRNSALATIFGSDAMRAASVLYASGAKGVHQYTAAVNDQGAAADVAAAKTDNLIGDIDRLKGSVETLAIKAGSASSNGLRVLVQGLDHVAGGLASLPPVVTGTGVAIAGLAGTVLLGAAAYVKARSTWTDFLGALESTGTRGTKAAGVLGKVGGTLGKLGAYGAVAGVALVGISAFIDYVNDKAGPTARDVDKLTGSLNKLAQSGKASGELANAFGSDLQGLTKDLELLRTAQAEIAKLRSGIPGGGKGAPAPKLLDAQALEQELKQAKVDITALDESLAKLASNGGATQAKIAFLDLAAAAGLTIDQLPKYQEAAGGAALANSALAKGFGDATANALTMAGSMQEAIASGQSMLDVFNQLNGGTLSFRDAQRQAEQSLDDVKAALDASNGSLSIHTEKGREAAASVDGMAKAAAEAAQKKFDETKSIELANGVYNDYIGQLKSTMRQAGLSKDEVDRLIKKIASMPAYKSTTITIKTQYVELDPIASHHDSYKRWGGVTEHAATGLLRDPAIYSAVSPARYAFAEPATGGEAFVPRRGDYGRSMGILSRAAGWYGAEVVPRGGYYGGSSGTVRVEITGGVVVEGTGVISGLRREIGVSGKTVQEYLGPASRRP